MIEKPFYNFKVSSDFSWFEFDSVSESKTIRKAVAYYQTDIDDMVQLVFGDLLSNGKIDIMSVSNNHDMVSVLSTVIRTIFLFLEHYPEKTIIFTGSNLARTRLYRATITKLLINLSPYFEIQGFKNTGELTDFESDNHYEAFLIRRRYENL